MGKVAARKDGMIFIHRPCSLVGMLMSSLDDIDLVLIHQVLKMNSQGPRLPVAVCIRGVEWSMGSYYDPLSVPIASSLFQIILEIVVLLRTSGIVVL